MAVEFDSKDGAIDMLKWIDGIDDIDGATNFIITRVLVAAHSLPDGVVRKKTRGRVNEKVFEALKTSPIRDFLKLRATPYLMGNTFQVNVDSNGASLLIDYVLPAGQPEPPPFG